MANYHSLTSNYFATLNLYCLHVRHVAQPNMSLKPYFSFPFPEKDPPGNTCLASNALIGKEALEAL